MRCDTWLDIEDHRCTRKATETVILDKPVRVKGKAMYGTYKAGEWHFCTQHHKLFQSGREDLT